MEKFDLCLRYTNLQAEKYHNLAKEIRFINFLTTFRCCECGDDFPVQQLFVLQHICFIYTFLSLIFYSLQFVSKISMLIFHFPSSCRATRVTILFKVGVNKHSRRQLPCDCVSRVWKTGTFLSRTFSVNNSPWRKFSPFFPYQPPRSPPEKLKQSPIHSVTAQPRSLCVHVATLTSSPLKWRSTRARKTLMADFATEAKTASFLELRSVLLRGEVQSK